MTQRRKAENRSGFCNAWLERGGAAAPGRPPARSDVGRSAGERGRVPAAGSRLRCPQSYAVPVSGGEFEEDCSMHLTDTLAGNRDVFPLPALKRILPPPP